LHLSERLPPDIEERLQVLVERGRFRNTTDALLAAVHLLEERDQRLDRLQADLRVGEDQAMRGELIDFTPELLDELSREAEERSRRNEPIRDAVKP
jgi:Arc/MetJ-type ribon-helix-helix transcriptional regulator